MVLHALTQLPAHSARLKSINVIEREADVIALVGDHYRGLDRRITIHHADAFKWKPRGGGKVFDCAWHDIWDDMCADNRVEFRKLRAHYRPFMRAARCKNAGASDSLRGRR